MPLYLARGPATVAFLIRARDRDHLNYILDAELDPGAFEAEVYDGPLALVLSLPAELEGEPDYASASPDLRVRWTGQTEWEALMRLPKVAAFDVYDEGWEHLRRCAFPKLAELLDEVVEAAVAEGGAPVATEVVEAAVAEEVIAQGRRAFWREERAQGEERERREQLGVTVAIESLLAGGRAHGQWRAEGWAEVEDDLEDDDLDEEDDPEDDDDLEDDDLGDEDDGAAGLGELMAAAIERFGEVSLAVTAEGIRWRVGNPVVAEGATLAELLERR